MICTHRILSQAGRQVWRTESPGCSDCEWDRLVRWAVERRLVRSVYADPVEISRAILGYISELEKRRSPG